MVMVIGAARDRSENTQVGILYSAANSIQENRSRPNRLCVSRRLWPAISVGKKATAELESSLVSPQQQPAAFAPIWCDGKKQREKDKRQATLVVTRLSNLCYGTF
jgi:hypothetical protein